MGSRNVPVLQAILPSYIVIRKPPFSPQFYHAWVLLLIFPHQSHGGVTVAGVKLVDRWSWKHTARCVHHLSGEKGLIVLLRERWGIKKMKMYPPPHTCGECHSFLLPVEQTGVCITCWHYNVFSNEIKTLMGFYETSTAWHPRSLTTLYVIQLWVWRASGLLTIS